MNEPSYSLYQGRSNPSVLRLSWEKSAGFPVHFHSPKHTETWLKITLKFKQLYIIKLNSNNSVINKILSE